jgi:putative hydrolase of the HAD superfamily
MKLPRAVLLDLDDTILDNASARDDAWDDACRRCGLTDDIFVRTVKAIRHVRDWFWSDAERHRLGRHDLNAAWRRIAADGLTNAGLHDHTLACRIADLYTNLREERLQLLPGAVEAVMWFRASGCRTALVTNGASIPQRDKLARFRLEPLFDSIVVEGEMGFGKPDLRVFQHALTAVEVAAEEAWMVGDNLDWDIVPAKALGLHAVWVDVSGGGLPVSATCAPDRIVRGIGELREGT